MQQLLIAMLVVIIAYLLYCECMGEGMSQTRERASKIYDWFTQNSDPKYVDYREDVRGGHSLEYYDVKNLKTQGQLSVDNIEKVIG